MVGRAASILLVVLVALLSPGRASAVTFISPDWFIDITDSGYSDFLNYTSPPASLLFPPSSDPNADGYDMLSGEWAAAIGYNGIQSSQGITESSMWLEPNFEYPDWTTNSTFSVVDPIAIDGVDGSGLPFGHSTIATSDVSIRIDYAFVDTLTGTPMGLDPASGGGGVIFSNRYVLDQLYTITNVSDADLTDVRFYQFLHAHPANNETPGVEAVYDTSLYAGALSGFRYDVTQFSTNTGDPNGEPTGFLFTDHVGFSSDAQPDDWGFGTYVGGDIVFRPPSGLHIDVEQDTLGNETSFGPAQVAGAQMWITPVLAPNASASRRVVLSLSVVPEPSAGFLLGLSLAGLAVMRGRHRKA